MQILFRLTEGEAEYLCSLVERSEHSKQVLLRSMVMDYRLCEKSDSEFCKIMRELLTIGNRTNQLTAKASVLNFVDTPVLYDKARRWRGFRPDVSRSYLVPREKSD